MNHALLDKTEGPAVCSGDEDVRQYLLEIRQYPRLTPEQEQALARRCAAGEEEAIRQMVNCNLRLVVSVAREYAGRGVPLLDLIQEGSIGLITAAKKFDYTLDYRFSTYATKWIRQGILRCLNEHGGLIRVPAHTADRMRKIDSEKAAFTQEFGREPSNEELARRLDIPESKVVQLRQLTPETFSLDAPLGEEGEGVVADFFFLEGCEPQAEMIRQELKNMMDDLLSRLNDRQQQILRLRFGIEDGKLHSLDEIAKMLGISKERVRQIERQAMDKLQKMGANLGLEDFLE